MDAKYSAVCALLLQELVSAGGVPAFEVCNSGRPVSLTGRTWPSLTAAQAQPRGSADRHPQKHTQSQTKAICGLSVTLWGVPCPHSPACLASEPVQPCTAFLHLTVALPSRVALEARFHRLLPVTGRRPGASYFGDRAKVVNAPWDKTSV